MTDDENPADVIEQAAQVREQWESNAERAEAEVAEVRGRLAELLDNLTGGRMSGTNYPVRVMVQEVEAYFERTQDSEVAELRATVERVRELADQWSSNPRYQPQFVHYADLIRAALDVGEQP